MHWTKSIALVHIYHEITMSLCSTTSINLWLVRPGLHVHRSLVLLTDDDMCLPSQALSGLSELLTATPPGESDTLCR